MFVIDNPNGPGLLELASSIPSEPLDEEGRRLN